MHLDNGHWQSENFTQRVLRKELRELLLEHGDRIIVNGRLRRLKSRHIGAGVYELYKEKENARSN